VFIETHFDPSKSLSDGPNMVPFAKLPAVVQKLKALHILANT
jgi:2-dehydro-3-deoxyphosphooctonate aldolase (KDO 8-P synthase)